MADLQPQPSIGDVRSKAHMALINRLKALDLSSILVYKVATCIDSVVLPLAWQFDVLNPLLLPEISTLVTLQYPGWDVITNIDTLINVDLLQYQADVLTPTPESVLLARYRALILLSTKLHSMLGTAGAIPTALAGLGYPGARVQEGQNSWGGTSWPSNEGWAVFRVLINLANVPPDSDFTTLAQRITAIANYWKPARCWLDSVQFGWFLHDQLMPPVTDLERNIYRQRDVLSPLPSDFIAAPAWPVSDIKTVRSLHDGRYYKSNSVTYGATQPKVAEGPVVINGVAVKVS